MMTVFMYVEEDRNSRDKLAMLTSKVGEDIKSTLDRLDSMNRALFLTAGFQDNAERLAGDDADAIDNILGHFSLIISQDPYLAKNVLYVPGTVTAILMLAILFITATGTNISASISTRL